MVSPDDTIQLTSVEQELLCSALRGRTEELLAILDNESYRQVAVGEAFVLAASRKRQQVLELLLDRGVDINHVGYVGKTALRCAIGENAQRIVTFLKERGATEPDGPGKVCGPRNEQERSLLLGAKTNNLELVDSALARGVDVRATDKSGLTAMMNAADRGLLDIVVRLAEAGVDLNELSSTGQTALDYALHVWSVKPQFYQIGKWTKRWRYYRNKRQVVEWLIDRGALCAEQLGVGETIPDPVAVEMQRREKLSHARKHLDQQILHVISVIIPSRRETR